MYTNKHHGKKGHCVNIYCYCHIHIKISLNTVGPSGIEYVFQFDHCTFTMNNLYVFGEALRSTHSCYIYIHGQPFIYRKEMKLTYRDYRVCAFKINRI